jgi:hypothetical protein
MKVTRRSMVVGGAVLALAAGGVGAATAIGGGDDGEGGATGPAAERAREAALALFPGGHANAVERDSEDGAVWEVELTRADGKTVDVRLDRGYGLVVVESDSEDER